jgi:hypothetical protein
VEEVDCCFSVPWRPTESWRSDIRPIGCVRSYSRVSGL